MNRNTDVNWKRNTALASSLSAVQVFLVIMPVLVPFFLSKGLTMQDVFLLQALFAVLVLLLEVPSGYLADLWGRRNAMVLGAVFCGLGHSTLVVADGFWDLAIFEAFLALARSLVSGADLAIVHDSAAASGGGRERGVVGRLYSLRTASEAVAALVCSALLTAGTLADVALLQASVGWLPLLLACFVREPPRVQAATESHRANLAKVLRVLWRSGWLLRLVVLTLWFWSLTTYFAVWLLQKVWLDQGVALSQFGVFWAMLMLLAAASGRWSSNLESWMGARPLLLFAGLAPVAGYLALISSGVVVSLLAGGLFFIARGVGLVLLQDALNRRVPSDLRATALSVVSFGTGLAAAVMGPVVGTLVDQWPMTTVLILLAGFSGGVFGGLVIPLVFRVRPETRSASVAKA